MCARPSEHKCIKKKEALQACLSVRGISARLSNQHICKIKKETGVGNLLSVSGISARGGPQYRQIQIQKQRKVALANDKKKAASTSRFPSNPCSVGCHIKKNQSTQTHTKRA
jgi:hypothetical protein